MQRQQDDDTAPAAAMALAAAASCCWSGRLPELEDLDDDDHASCAAAVRYILVPAFALPVLVTLPAFFQNF